ncbi:SapB/AmfS family lanthipeptide [Streptomyces sp. NPDC087440]
MSILDLQSMETPTEEANGDVEHGGGGGGGGSRASLLLCGDSSLSVTTCH